jgi:phospholipid/cholesterol/gamma-HCH transport system substrate-binding protein
METRAHYVAVGAFVLTMVALAFVAVLWMARASLTTEYANYDIYFKGPVTGLRKGAAVDYNGVPVGKVGEIAIVPFQRPLVEDEDTDDTSGADDAPATMIRVTVEIDRAVEIKEDVRASVETNILSGVSYILIIRGSLKAPVLRAKPGERYPVIAPRRSRLASVTAQAPELLGKLNTAVDHVNELLNDKNRRAITETIENVRGLSAGIAETNKDIATLATSANTAVLGMTQLIDNVDRSYSGQDGIGDRLANAIADFDRLAKNLIDTNRQLQLTVQDVRPGVRNFSQQTLGDVGALIGEARRLIGGLSRLTAEIERDPSRILLGDRREGYRPK